MARKLENWIDSFSSLFGSSGAPELFRKWAGLATVAGVMERRFFVDVGRGPLYPNMYIVLVAPPGIGKTVLTSEVWKLWYELSTGNADGMHVAPPSMTAASVIDSLRDADRKFYSPSTPLEPLRYNSLAICSNELGTLLPAYDPEMMNRLTDIYDGHPYAERRRTKDLNFKIERPQINFLAATTPVHLSNSMPEGAWDQGFLSRTMMIFSAERNILPLFNKRDDATVLRKELQNDLRHIFSLAGEIKFSEPAAAAISAWHDAGGPPAPDHPRLSNYTTRRTAHLLKLCMISSLAVRDTLIIELDDFNVALNWLLEAEMLMPDIFKAMVVNADSKAMDECWHFAYNIWMKEQQPVAEHRIVAFLAERVPVQNVMRMLDVLVQQAIFTKTLVSGVGSAYQPKPRKR